MLQVGLSVTSSINLQTDRISLGHWKTMDCGSMDSWITGLGYSHRSPPPGCMWPLHKDYRIQQAQFVAHVGTEPVTVALLLLNNLTSQHIRELITI